MIIILAVIAVIGGFLAIQISKRFQGMARKILTVVTVLYGMGFLYFTLLSRTTADGNVINVIPFYTIIRSLRYPLHMQGLPGRILSGQWKEILTTTIPIRTAFLNVLLFIPLGYLIPEWTNGDRTRLRTVTLISLGLSCTIEIVQLVTGLGWCDVDDLICDVLGGMLGYAAYRISLKRGRKGKNANE